MFNRHAGFVARFCPLMMAACLLLGSVADAAPGSMKMPGTGHKYYDGAGRPWAEQPGPYIHVPGADGATEVGGRLVGFSLVNQGGHDETPLLHARQQALADKRAAFRACQLGKARDAWADRLGYGGGYNLKTDWKAAHEFLKPYNNELGMWQGENIGSLLSSSNILMVEDLRDVKPQKPQMRSRLAKDGPTFHHSTYGPVLKTTEEMEQMRRGRSATWRDNSGNVRYR